MAVVLSARLGMTNREGSSLVLVSVVRRARGEPWNGWIDPPVYQAKRRRSLFFKLFTRWSDLPPGAALELTFPF